jgi:CNT family concentrative nucleoside transporter
MQGLLGACLIMVLAWALGRFQAVNIKKISILLIMHLVLTWVFLKAPGLSPLLKRFGQGLEGLQESVRAGTSFVFGYIGGAPAPFVPLSGKGSPFILLFQALPTIVVMGSISMMLFHTGLLPRMVRGISKGIAKTKLIGGGLATALAGKLFLGQSDTPLLVRPYLQHFSKNELFTLITAGMATSVSTIFVLYSQVLSGGGTNQDTLLIHLVASAVTNILASLMIAEYMMPEGENLTNGECENPYVFQNIMQAITRGASDGWNIMMMIAATMLALVALVDMANQVLGSITQLLLNQTITIQSMLGYVFSPLSWCMGISWSDGLTVGSILGEKTLLNEWVAIANISQGIYGPLSPRTLTILLPSLCAFSNISSIGIQIACLGALAPSRTNEIVKMCSLALVASVLAGALSSAVVSIIIE